MERLQLSSGQLCLRASRYQFDCKSMERLQGLSGQMHIRAKNHFDSIGQLIVKHPSTNLKIRKDSKVLVKFSKPSDPILGSEGVGSLFTRDIMHGMSPLAALILGIANIVLWIAKVVFLISLIMGISNFVLGIVKKVFAYLVVLYKMSIKKGDLITILCEKNELTGTVEDLGFFTCTLNTLGAAQIVVPTNTLITGTIFKLNGAESHFKWNFCVPFSCVMNFRNSAEELQEAMNEIPTIKRGSPTVHLHALNPETKTLTIAVTCLTKIEKLEEYYLTTDKVLSSVWTVFHDKNLD